MNLRKYLSIVVLSVFSAYGSFALAADVASVLKELPANSELVVVTPNTDELISRLVVYAGQFGAEAEDLSLDKLRKEFSDKYMGGKEFALDGKSPAVLALTSILAGNKSWILYVPVADASVVTGGLTSEKLPSGIYKLKNDFFMTTQGNYLVFGGNDFNLNGAMTGAKGFTTMPVIVSDMGKNDLTIYANLTNAMNVGRVMIPAALLNSPELQGNPELTSRVQNMVTTATEIDRVSFSLDFQDGGISTSSTFSVLPTGKLAGYLKKGQQANIADFAKMPDGNVMDMSACNIKTELLKSYLTCILDLSTMSAPQFKTPEMQNSLKNVSGLLDKVLEKYSSEYDSVSFVSVDYLSNKEGIPAEKRPISVVSTIVKPEMAKEITKMSVEADLSPLVKVREYKPEAGVENGCSYSTLFMTMNQPLGVDSYLNTDMDFYYGWTGSGFVVQALDKDAFSEVVALAGSDAKLAGNAMYKKAVAQLPASANLYVIFDVKKTLELLTKNYETQTRQLAKSQPEVALGMALIDPAIKAAGTLDGVAGVAVVVDDGFVRINSFCDGKVIESAVEAVKSLESAGSKPEENEPAQQTPVTEL